MAKRTTYLKDDYFNYRLIALAAVVLLTFFIVSSRITEFIGGHKSNHGFVDVTSYLKDAKKLVVINEEYSMIAIEYSQFNNDNEYLSTNKNIKPEFSKSDDGTEVTMKFPKQVHQAYEIYGVDIIVYGPSLDSVEVRGPVEMTYSGSGSLSVDNEGSDFNIRAGDRYENVTLTSGVGARSRLDYADIKNLEVNLDAGVVTAGEVDTLKTHFVAGCGQKGANFARRVLTVESVTSGLMVYNDAERPAQSITNDCGRMVIGI